MPDLKEYMCPPSKFDRKKVSFRGVNNDDGETVTFIDVTVHSDTTLETHQFTLKDLEHVCQ